MRLFFAFFHFLTSFSRFLSELNSILKTVSQNAEKGADFCVFSGTKKSQDALYDGVLGQIVAEKEGFEPSLELPPLTV